VTQSRLFTATTANNVKFFLTHTYGLIYKLQRVFIMSALSMLSALSYASHQSVDASTLVFCLTLCLKVNWKVWLTKLLELEWHSVERIPPPRPLMSQNCYYWTNAG